MTQLFALYEYSAEEDRMWMEFKARIQGIDMDKVSKETHDGAVQPMLFRDPADYEKMSEEERDELTKQMMGYHRGWIRKSALREKN